MRFNNIKKNLLIRDARFYFESLGLSVDWVKFNGSQAFARFYRIPWAYTRAPSHIIAFDMGDKHSVRLAGKEAMEAI